eukprot:649771-Rhodomonas_salina.1
MANTLCGPGVSVFVYVVRYWLSRIRGQHPLPAFSARCSHTRMRSEIREADSPYALCNTHC